MKTTIGQVATALLQQIEHSRELEYSPRYLQAYEFYEYLMTRHGSVAVEFATDHPSFAEVMSELDALARRSGSPVEFSTGLAALRGNPANGKKGAQPFFSCVRVTFSRNLAA